MNEIDKKIERNLRSVFLFALFLIWLLSFVFVMKAYPGDTVIVNSGETIISAGDSIHGGVRVDNRGNRRTQNDYYKSYRDYYRFYETTPSIIYNPDGSTSIRIGSSWIHHGLAY